MQRKNKDFQSQEEKRQYQNLLMKKKKYIAQSDRHLKQITKLTYQMDQVSDNTALQLQGQTKKLNRIQNIGNDIGKQMKKAEKHSKQMTSFWYYLKQKIKGLVVSQPQDDISSKQPVKYQKSQKRVQNINQKNNQEIKNINVYHSEPILDEIDEQNYQAKQDQQLDQISKQLQRLKLKARGIGNQLDTQSEIIGRIDKKMDQNSAKIQKVDKKLKKHFF